MGHLHRPWRSLLLGLLLLVSVGCERARRYPEVKTSAGAATGEPKKQEPLPAHYTWLEPELVADIPIVFIDSVSKAAEWKKLPGYWNHFPEPGAGTRLAHVGMSPLGAVVGLVGADQLEIIKIKVPLGLPDPTPQIPPANPPTFAKWQLGKRLFFDRTLLGATDGGCANCHRPEEAFTQRHVQPLHTRMMDTLSLINCVYNRAQFWDGRVGALEETIQRTLEDERSTQDASPTEPPNNPHVWSGILGRLNKNSPDRLPYRADFQRVFGIQQATQDTVGKALATYMRTILSGDSLYDRAVQATGKNDDGQLLTAKDFEPLLDKETLTRLGRPEAPKAEAALELAGGYRLFHGRAGCATCHGGWNFTDNDFHNIGIRESDWPMPREFPGKFRHQPIGLKDARMIGAFRTPSLRNLPRTPPYFHDPYFRNGGIDTLEAAVQYFNAGADALLNSHLDPLLLAGPKTPRVLDLHRDDVRTLVLFLRALDGEPVPAVVAARPKE